MLMHSVTIVRHEVEMRLMEQRQTQLSSGHIIARVGSVFRLNGDMTGIFIVSLKFLGNMRQ